MAKKPADAVEGTSGKTTKRARVSSPAKPTRTRKQGIEQQYQAAIGPLRIQRPGCSSNNEGIDPQRIARDALETNVVVHLRLADLITSFLRLKRVHGSDIEKKIYANVSQHDLIVRLIQKRCLHFVNAQDYTVLRDGTPSQKGGGLYAEEWLRVGQANEHLNKYIKMEDYLSYDEMMLASLIGTSGPTFFNNTGDRENCAREDPAGTFEDRDIIVGLVGARLLKQRQMDAALMCRHIENALVKENEGRQQDSRVTKLFLKFFGSDKLPTSSSRFNYEVYKARIRHSIETLLLEAEDRAAAASQTAYVHLTGLGLGVWALDKARQGEWYVEVCIDILRSMNLAHINMLEIAWASAEKATKKRCIDAGKAVGIQVRFNKRPPCEKLGTGELLVRCWAWDSNTLPGNEYWSGIIDESDDPAGVCNSTAADLHNPYVNLFAHRVKVSQDRVRV